MKAHVVNIKDLYGSTGAEMMALEHGVYDVHTEQGVVKTTKERLILAWPTWEVNRRYGISPSNKQLLPIRELVKGDDGKLFEQALETCYFAYVEDHPEADPADTYADMCRYTMLGKNLMHDHSIIEHNRYVNSLTAFDFYKVMNDEVIVLAASKVEDTEESMMSGIDFAVQEVKDDRFRNNSVGRVIRKRIVSDVQATQMWWMRGATTDIDSRIFPRSIMKPYMGGIRDVEFSAIESRQTSKAQLFQQSPMRDSEYLHRQFQIVMMYITQKDGSLRIGRQRQLLPSNECGTTQRLDFPVRNKKDLEAIIGLLHGDEDQYMISGSESHLIGKTIRLRLPIHCATSHRGHVCAGCLGMYSNIIPRGGSVGLISAAEFMEKIVQAVLSVKHSEGSSVMKELTLTDRNAKYFHVGSDGRSFKLKHKFKHANPSILIKTKFVENLSDVLRQDYSVEEGDNVGSIASIMLEYLDSEGDRQRVVIPTMLSSTHSHLSKPLIEHIRKVNFETTPKGEYRIDLKGWDYTESLLILEMRHVSMPDFMAQVRTFVKSGLEKGDRITMNKVMKDFTDAGEALLALHKLVNETIHVNLVHLAVLVKSMQCRGVYRKDDDFDYQLPLLGEPYRFAKYDDVIVNRSSSASMIFERQFLLIDSPRAFDDQMKPAHPADMSFMR